MGLLLALLSGPALANVAAAQHRPAIAGSLWTAGTALAVASEQLAITCVEEDDAPRCTFVATYAVRNDTGTAQATVAAFVGERARDVRLTFAGARVDREFTADEGAALARVPGARRGGLQRGASLSLEPGASAALVAEGRLEPERYFRPSYSQPALWARHPVLGSPVHRTHAFHVQYEVAPIRSWAAGAPPPRISLTLTVPRQWDTLVSLRRPGGDEASRHLAPSPGVTRERGDERVHEVELDSAQVDTLELDLQLPRRTLRHGGPFVALGGALGPSGGLRARLGYEVAAPEWLLWSVTGETDFSRLLQFAAVAEAATELLLIIPSVSVGLGVPVRVLPERQVGARAQVSLQWPYVGFVASLDVFPFAADVLQVSLLGRASF